MTILPVLADFDENGSCLRLKVATHALPTMSMMVGIAVSNEEQNIGNLLENLGRCSPQRLKPYA